MKVRRVVLVSALLVAVAGTIGGTCALQCTGDASSSDRDWKKLYLEVKRHSNDAISFGLALPAGCGRSWSESQAQQLVSALLDRIEQFSAEEVSIWSQLLAELEIVDTMVPHAWSLASLRQLGRSRPDSLYEYARYCLEYCEPRERETIVEALIEDRLHATQGVVHVCAAAQDVPAARRFLVRVSKNGQIETLEQAAIEFIVVGRAPFDHIDRRLTDALADKCVPLAIACVMVSPSSGTTSRDILSSIISDRDAAASSTHILDLVQNYQLSIDAEDESRRSLRRWAFEEAGKLLEHGPEGLSSLERFRVGATLVIWRNVGFGGRAEQRRLRRLWRDWQYTCAASSIVGAGGLNESAVVSEGLARGEARRMR